MKKFLLLSLATLLGAAAPAQTVRTFLTRPDRSELFAEQSETVEFSDRRSGRAHCIVVDPRQRYQRLDGFGFALTGGSAQHLAAMSAPARRALLEELFDPERGIGISCIRLTLGASDLNSFVFSYDDMPAGGEDFPLAHFSLAQDLRDVVPVMREILEIAPDIQVLSSPWSAPAWMKTNGDVRGGQLREACYGVYADYFVRYVEAMRDRGIEIDAVTVQNEPLNSRNTPSMYWFANQQAAFVRDHLGPKFRDAGLSTKIVVFDHNCDRPDYALAVYNDPEAAKYIAGAAFHHYRGDLSAMSYVHEARPDKEIYFTEQMTTERPGQPRIDIAQAVERLVIGITRNWSRNVVLWNLAADPDNDPHTDNGGCSMCQGAVTIDGDRTERNLAYWVVAHASKFVRPGSVRIASTEPADRSIVLDEDEQRPGVFRANVAERSGVAPNVAFRTPDGHIVLVVANDSWSRRSISIQYNGRFAELPLEPGAAATFVWDA
ncbi:glycoside hydrolase family 30 protein [Alistipes sp.]|uniref:glycoside hydrolase family 30 protein n=1 Tax=Alistipes sp. TaxID=1872444 RepID=UPI003AEF736E